jgi:hypothetical protein
MGNGRNGSWQVLVVVAADIRRQARMPAGRVGQGCQTSRRPFYVYLLRVGGRNVAVSDAVEKNEQAKPAVSFANGS